MIADTCCRLDQILSDQKPLWLVPNHSIVTDLFNYLPYVGSDAYNQLPYHFSFAPLQASIIDTSKHNMAPCLEYKHMELLLAL